MAMTVTVYDHPLAVADAAAKHIRKQAHAAVQQKGCFLLALSGGRTPNVLYSLLADTEYLHTMPWDQILFFWGDERYVSPAHPDSNYGTAMKLLFSRVPVPARNVYPMWTMAPQSSQAAELYEQTLQQVLRETGQLGFDLTILGMGTDGHTASLFPGSPALEEQKHWVAPVTNPAGQARLTLTLPLLNASHDILFLVTGEEKKTMLAAVLDDHATGESSYPASRVKARRNTDWLVDAAASN